MSPETYRDLIKPYHQAICQFIHEHSDAKILLHSCGAIFPLIGDLIEAGFDILNPVQTRAKGMEPDKLKDALLKDLDQVARKYRKPKGKAKATRGVLKDRSHYESLTRDPHSYDLYAGVTP